jgi:hypothetical protein
MSITPPCPDGLYEFRCEYCEIDLVCYLEYIPAEKGSVDSYGAPYEPNIDEDMDVVSVYVQGSDMDLMPIISLHCVEFLERMALVDLKAYK